MSPVARMYVVGAILGVLGSTAMITSVFAASDARGTTAAGTTMFAGPNTDYPQVMRLAGGLQVAIHGCMSDWQWCDVTWRGKRGWVAAAALEYHGNGERVALATGPHPAIPTANFEFNSYWNANYRARLWYSDRAKWQSLDGHSMQAADAGSR